MFNVNLAIFASFLTCCFVGCNRQGPETIVKLDTDKTLVNKPANEDLPSADWKQVFGNQPESLTNYPAISIIESRGDTCRVKATNQGRTILLYEGYGPSNAAIYQEFWKNEEWNCGEYTWCGTGLDWYELRPNQSVELIAVFRDSNKRERLLAEFSEMGTTRRGLIVLAAETEK